MTPTAVSVVQITTIPSSDRNMPSNHRLFRYSVSTLLVVITIIAACLGRTAFVARQRDAAISVIEKSGGRIRYDTLIDKRLSTVRRWWRDLWGDAYSNQVYCIYLKDVPVTDAAALDLVKLPEIEDLMLTCPEISDATLERLKPLDQQLKCLYLNGSKVTDQGLMHLRSFVMLEEIGLYLTDVTDAGVEHLAQIPSLRHVILSNTRITDESLEHLKRLPRLERLEVYGTAVSNEALAKLQAVNPALKLR